jgi:hypothetical protein
VRGILLANLATGSRHEHEPKSRHFANQDVRRRPPPTPAQITELDHRLVCGEQGNDLGTLVGKGRDAADDVGGNRPEQLAELIGAVGVERD